MSILRRSLSYFCIAAALAFFSGCTEINTPVSNAGNTVDATVIVSLGTVGDTLVGLDTSAIITGGVVSTASFVVSVAVLDSLGATASGVFAVYNASALVGTSSLNLSSDLGLRVASLSTAAAGRYTLRIIAQCATAADTATGVFQVGSAVLENPDSADINITQTSLALIIGGNAATITGTYACSEVPVFTWDITDSSGVSHNSAFTVSSFSPTTNTGNLGFALAAKSTEANGTYSFTVCATSGSATKWATLPVTVTGGSVIPTDTALSEKVLTLGSWQNATLGSSLEADSMIVMMVSAAAAASANVDLWFSNISDGTANLFSPSSAAAVLYSPKNWTTKNTTVIVKVTGQTWANITTQTQVNTIAAAALADATTQRLVITAGNIIALKTNHNNYRLIYITSAEGTNAGTASIKALVK